MKCLLQDHELNCGFFAWADFLTDEVDGVGKERLLKHIERLEIEVKGLKHCVWTLCSTLLVFLVILLSVLIMKQS